MPVYFLLCVCVFFKAELLQSGFLQGIGDGSFIKTLRPFNTVLSPPICLLLHNTSIISTAPPQRAIWWSLLLPLRTLLHLLLFLSSPSSVSLFLFTGFFPFACNCVQELPALLTDWPTLASFPGF